MSVFAGVIGHDAVIRLLENEAASPAQAYLFTGPESVGKGTVARRFAAALLCGDDAGCLRRVLGGNHPDLVAVEPEGRSAITVDQARRVVSRAALAPMEADRKVFLFEEGGAMNDEAANSLLKTLEEPTATTTFIIVAESADELPATIASRCRTVVFGRVPDPELAEALAAVGVEREQAERAAGISGGRPGLALALATRPEVAEFRRVWLTLPLHLPDHPGDAYRLADDVIAAAEPLLAAIRARHEEQEEAVAGDASSSLKSLKERHERELKRATTALFVTGLEILAGFYRDAAAAQFGVPPRNADVPVTAFTHVRPRRALAAAARVLDAVDALHANQRPHLTFAALFADLGGEG
jgi:DNA polymerase III subunit delta'